jgi:hypothetical protein
MKKDFIIGAALIVIASIAYVIKGAFYDYEKAIDTVQMLQHPSYGTGYMVYYPSESLMYFVEDSNKNREIKRDDVGRPLVVCPYLDPMGDVSFDQDHLQTFAEWNPDKLRYECNLS